MKGSKASLTAPQQKQNGQHGKKHRFGKAWMHEHLNDYHVKEAKRLGYRSRAAFKLLEIDQEYGLIQPGARVVDLGCAPGGWSQVVAQKLAAVAAQGAGKEGLEEGKDRGYVIGVDLLPMEPIAQVQFVQGDFTEMGTLQRLLAFLEQKKVDLVLSDMAPNISGIVLSDQARSYYLAELALEFALEWLKPGGNFLIKAFQGSDIDAYRLTLRHHFKKVLVLKPEASRGRSREIYLLSQGKK